MKPRPKPSRAKGGQGSRVWLVLVAVVVFVLIAYYVVVPLLFPPKPRVSGPVVSLNPSTDISGSLIVMSGTRFSANSSLTATYDAHPLNLTGTCRTDTLGNFSGCEFIVPVSGSGSHTVSVVSANQTVNATFNIPGVLIPESTFLVALTSLGVSLFSQLVTRRVVDLDKERRMRAEVAAFNKEKREATLAKDKAALDRLKKRDLAIKQEQAKVTTARFKVTAVTIVPLLGIYYLMASFLGGYGVTVAYSPFIGSGIPILSGSANGGLALFWWYFLCSFLFSSLLQRMLRTGTSY